jgi:hypothetical protein
VTLGIKRNHKIMGRFLSVHSGAVELFFWDTALIIQ